MQSLLVLLNTMPISEEIWSENVEQSTSNCPILLRIASGKFHISYKICTPIGFMNKWSHFKNTEKVLMGMSEN